MLRFVQRNLAKMVAENPFTAKIKRAEQALKHLPALSITLALQEQSIMSERDSISASEEKLVEKRTSLRSYQTWTDMKQRCYNSRHKQFKNYGARGITICDRWLRSFDNFYMDMGERPVGLSIDRIDNDAGYSPENCRWATAKVQRSNSRACHLLTYRGETLNIYQWAEKLGIHPITLSARIRTGMDVELALAPGDRHPRRLSDEVIQQIRLRKGRPLTEVAKEFGIHPGYASKILNGKVRMKATAAIDAARGNGE
jgi:hypothetical protein